MRVLVAGAAGAIGRQLVPMLIAAGHEVTGTTRYADRDGWLESEGAGAALVDAYDADALSEDVASTGSLGEVGTRNLVAGALAVGARRLVTQSGASRNRGPDEIAFDIDAITAGADVNYTLFDDARYLEQGRSSVRRLLETEAA